MSRIVSRGYLLPTAECFSASDWELTPVGHEALANPHRIDNWDYATDLVAVRTIAVDREAVYDQARLHPQDELRCVIQWTAATDTSTGLQGASLPQKVVGGAQKVQCVIPGVEIGGVLQLRTTVSLVIGSNDGRDALAPRRTGSMLWSDEFRVILEGDASRFPAELLSFSANDIGPLGGAWRVMVDTSDLDAPALSAVRVLFNTDHSIYTVLTQSPDSPEAILASKFLEYDVARQLVVAALADEELGAVEYERGSIGAVLRARLMTYFSDEGRDVNTLRQRWRLDPGEVEAELQPFFLGEVADA